jgi:hypothetical protein
LVSVGVSVFLGVFDFAFNFILEKVLLR